MNENEGKSLIATEGSKQTKQISTALIPKSLGEVMQLAQVLASSDMVPSHYQGEPGNIVAALQLGSELGIPPMQALTNSYPVNNRITFYTDMLMAIVKSQPDYAGQKIITETDKAFEIVLKRQLKNGAIDEYTSRFTMEDAIAAGLPQRNDVWKKYPKRMLRHRACAYAARMGWPDKLAGVYTYEEMQSVNPEDLPPINVTPKPDSGDMPEVPLGQAVASMLPKDPPELLELIELAKKAKLDAKAIKELKDRYRAVEDIKSAKATFLKKTKEDLEMKANRGKVIKNG